MTAAFGDYFPISVRYGNPEVFRQISGQPKLNESAAFKNYHGIFILDFNKRCCQLIEFQVNFFNERSVNYFLRIKTVKNIYPRTLLFFWILDTDFRQEAI